MTTTGVHSDEENELIPTGSKTVDHCFTEMSTTEPSCYFTFMQLKVTASNNSDYSDLETKTSHPMEAEEYIFGSSYCNKES